MENNLKKVLQKHGFSFKKAFGQNFLTDQTLLNEIVEKAGVTKADTVLEIGCGAGALTSVLADNAKRVVGFEIDQKLKPVLSEVLSGKDNVEIIYKDVLKTDLRELEKHLGDGYILVANLPYYITTPIIMTFLEKAKKVRALVVMVQEEVAYRLSANAGSSDYGAITVSVNFSGSASIIKRVPREMFTPAPNVDSAVVKIDIEKDKFAGVDYNSFREAVKCGFGNRRKMLVNNLMNTYKLTRVNAEEILDSCGISLTARGEVLAVEDYINLSQKLIEKTK